MDSNNNNGVKSPFPSPYNPHNVYILNSDPSPLGLFGLAIVTLAASSEKLGFTSGFSFLIPWALFLGAFAQLFACLNESQRNNTFGATAFGAFALFWFSNASVWLIKMGVFGKILSSQIDEHQLGFVFVGYFIFGIYMTFGATVMPRILFIIFCFVDLLFISLALQYFEVIPRITVKLAGISELIIAILGFYASAASVLNITLNRIVLPVGKPLSHDGKQ
ncbi:MAG: acetate uptake transporter [Chitinispirillaceae bacterium]|nr:acetate uptake transporter [Chitinispirillaceae bacterium]